MKVDLSRQYAGLTLLLPIEEESHSGAQVLQVQVRQEAPLKLRLHCVPTGSTAALKENHCRLAQQPISQLPHASAVLIFQCLPSPETEMQHVGGHTSTGALWRENNKYGCGGIHDLVCMSLYIYNKKHLAAGVLYIF